MPDDHLSEGALEHSIARIWGETSEFRGLVDAMGLGELQSDLRSDHGGFSELPSQRSESGKAEYPGLRRTKFQCRYPGCQKLYSSYDAVRKHCRKQHAQWLESYGVRGKPQPGGEGGLPLRAARDDGPVVRPRRVRPDS